MDLNFDFDSMFNNVEKIQPEPKRFGPDPRFWKLSRNDNDVGLARIRLLPSKVVYDGKEQLVPYVRVYKYAINLRPFGSKKFTEIESPQSVGKKCAVADLKKELNKIGTDEAKKVMEILKRNERYISNIYVVNDPIKTENNGQVKLWEYGVKLKDKFTGWKNPPKEDLAMGAKPINVYHPIEGADIKLVMRKSGGFYNYDDTTYYPPEPLFGGDTEKIKEILNKTYELTEWLQPDHYPTYDEEIDKLLWLFDGTKVEDILKSLGVSLYKGITTDNTIAPPKVENKEEQVENKETKNDEFDMKEFDEPKPKKQEQKEIDDDDLDFLDDLGD